MKSEVSLKRILAILIIVLVCLVSVGGIYAKDKNYFKNLLPEYKLGMDLDTNTIIKLDVEKDEGDSSEDADGQATEEKATEENKTSENIYTKDNYKKSKSVIEKRLKTAGVEQYSVRLDEQTGSLVLEVPKDIDLSLLQNTFAVGKTEIKVVNTVTESTEEGAEPVETQKEEVIGSSKDIKKITAAIDDSYASYGVGSFVKLDIEFNSNMVKKFKEMKNNANDVTRAGNKIQIVLDGSAICEMTETEFLESAVNGTLPLKYGDYSTDKDTVEKSLKQANIVKNVITNGELPLKYTVTYSNDVHTNINKYGIVSVFAVLLAVMFVYLVVKYRVKGVYAELAILGFGAFVLLLLRFTKVQISIATIVAIAGMLILQFIYLIKLLNSTKLSSKVFNENTIEFTKMIIPAFILSIVGAILPALKDSSLMPFGNIIEISDFGMVVFWGILLFELFNNIITRAILTSEKNK